MTCKAMVLVGDRTFEMREMAVPEPPPGGALLAVEGCGICGSDVEQYDGAITRMGMMRYPAITGHEPLGRIDKITAEGAKRWGVKEGDRVALHGVAPCGVCPGCMSGGKCADAFYYGSRAADIGSGLWGGFGEVMEIVPRAKLYPMSDRLSIEDALLYNPLAAGFDWAMDHGGVSYGDNILILGSGQRGLACVIAAAEVRASKIIVTGLRADADKLALARTFGATDTLAAEDSDVPQAVREITGGRGVDVVVDTTPLAFQPVRDAIESVKPQGTIVLGGLKAGRPMPDFPLDRIIDKQVRVQGVKSTSSKATHQAIDLVESGRHPLSLMNSHKMRLAELEKAIHILAGEVPGERGLHISIVHDMFF